MTGTRNNKVIRWAALSILSVGLALSCGKDDGGGQGTLKEIRVTPSVVVLRTTSSSVSLDVKGITTTGKRIDLKYSPDTTYASGDPSIATVTPVGIVVAEGTGVATITVSHLTFSAAVPTFCDYAPPLSDGDFDLAAPGEALKMGRSVTVPLILETGGRNFGSYQALVSYDQTQLKLIKVSPGADLGAPLAKRTDILGEVEVLGTYRPALGQSQTGTLEAARLVFRVTGDSGQSSTLTGRVVSVADDSFPAATLGPPTPRDFVTGRRWMPIE